MELTATIFPPCRCGRPYAGHDTADHAFEGVASEHCPDGVPVDVGLDNLVIIEHAAPDAVEEN